LTAAGHKTVMIYDMFNAMYYSVDQHIYQCSSDSGKCRNTYWSVLFY